MNKCIHFSFIVVLVFAMVQMQGIKANDYKKIQNVSPVTSVLSIRGTTFYMDGKPFYYQGLSFFNALYNQEFNGSDEIREKWMKTFKSYGITVIRIWGDWRVTNGWIDEGPDNSLYVYPVKRGKEYIYEPENPELAQVPLQRLKDLIVTANKLNMVIELCLFTHYLIYPVSTRNKYIQLIVEELRPYRNVIFQIWNEYSDHTVGHFELIKQLDKDRLVGNSPGGPMNNKNLVNCDEEAKVLDILMPHTTRKPPL